MGKKYYCDYCDKSFPDSAQNRSKHIGGVSHQKLVLVHYRQYRSPRELLAEDRGKRACRRAHTGECPFGEICRYSHLTPDERRRLEERVAAGGGDSCGGAGLGVTHNTFGTASAGKWERKRRKKPKLRETSADGVAILNQWLRKGGRRARLATNTRGEDAELERVLLDLVGNVERGGSLGNHGNQSMPASLQRPKLLDYRYAAGNTWGL